MHLDMQENEDGLTMFFARYLYTAVECGSRLFAFSTAWEIVLAAMSHEMSRMEQAPST